MGVQFPHGEVAEWSMATVLKTVNPAMGSRVRIPPSPPVSENYDLAFSNESLDISAVDPDAR